MTLWKNNNARRRVRNAAWGVLCLLAWTAASAERTITPAFRDADITQRSEAVCAHTGKPFIVGPRVRANVTILSSTPMTPEAFYQAFLSIRQVLGFMAVESGNVTKIL